MDKRYTKEQIDEIVKELEDLHNREHYLRYSVLMDARHTGYLLAWYNEHSDETWTYPNENAQLSLMDIELELLYRGEL